MRGRPGVLSGAWMLTSCSKKVLVASVPDRALDEGEEREGRMGVRTVRLIGGPSEIGPESESSSSSSTAERRDMR